MMLKRETEDGWASDCKLSQEKIAKKRNASSLIRKPLDQVRMETLKTSSHRIWILHGRVEKSNPQGHSWVMKD